MERLINRLFEIGAIKFGEFKLKAGDISPIYIDLRDIISHPDLLNDVAGLMAIKLAHLKHDRICGVPYGALSIASVISVLAKAPMVMFRKEAKEHGTKKRVEGIYSEGQTCVIIEDVVTTGSSVAETAKVLREHGLIVEDAIVILDREAGATEKLTKEGIKFVSLFKLNELVAHLPKDLDPDMRRKVEQYLRKETPAPTAANGTGVKNELWSLQNRRDLVTHPTARRLFDIMLKKKSNLCVAADFTDAGSILELARQIGPHICALKVHADIIEDFSMEFAKKLGNLAIEMDFLIMEDRKFADVGNVVALQTNGVHRLKEWVNMFTVHGVSGPGVLQGLKLICGDGSIACFMVAQMSSEKNLLDENYQKAIIQMASSYPELIGGFICQRRVAENPAWLYMSPGVHLELSNDKLGQQWRSPEYAIGRDKVDIVIVGRGVINDPDRKSAVERYQLVSWKAFVDREK